VAGPKALEHDRSFEFVVSAIELAIDFVGLDLDRHFAPERGSILDVYVHSRPTS
jgi:hypothetical protein